MRTAMILQATIVAWKRKLNGKRSRNVSRAELVELFDIPADFDVEYLGIILSALPATAVSHETLLKLSFRRDFP